MLLSIVILTNNQKELTLRCLESLKTMSELPDIELILVDNGSNDNTCEVVHDLYPKIKIKKSKKNLGVAGGRNFGIKDAQGKYIMILDNDTIATPSAILSLVNYLEKNPECGLVAPRLCNLKGETQKSFKDFPSLIEKTKNWIRGKKENNIVEKIPSSPLEPFYVIGAAQVFPRYIFQQLNGLDEKIFFGPEDADFCMRIRKLNKKVLYVPDVKIIHEWQRSTTGKLFNKRAASHIKGLLYFYWKHKRIF